MNDHDHNQAAETRFNRRIVERSDGSEVIMVTCPQRHTHVAPNKGLGRAQVAAWESRHQHSGAVSS